MIGLKFLISLLIAGFAGIFLIIFFTRYPINSFIVYSEQERTIERISTELKKHPDGIGIEVINPDNDWDTVCLVLPYSYSPLFSPYSEIREFYGQNYNRYRVFIPDPLSVDYGMIFSFLKNENISKLVHIPRYKSSISIENGVVVTPTEFDIGGAKISFDSLTFDLPKNQTCFGKGKANISISEDRVFKVEIRD